MLDGVDIHVIDGRMGAGRAWAVCVWRGMVSHGMEGNNRAQHNYYCRGIINI